MTNKEIAERIIDIICKNRVFCELYPDVCQKEKCDIYLVINMFLNTPDTDTPSRQRGEWQKEIKGNGWNEWSVLTCDQCGAVIENPTFETNYCPNCGADMRGEEE